MSISHPYPFHRCAILYSVSLCLLISLSALGCSAPDESTADASSPSSSSPSSLDQSITYYGHIKPILDAYCVDCHHSEGIAPFPLDEYTKLQDYIEPVLHSVQTQTMPPWGANDVGVPLKYDQRLSQTQIDQISQWAASGLPEGDPTQEGSAIEVDKGGLNRIDLTLTIPERYTPSRERLDDYRCFVLPWPLEEDQNIVGFGASPDNQKSVHHVVVFKIEPGQADLVDQFDALDEGPGYTCFGDANPSNWEPDELSDTLVYSFVGQWAPGQLGSAFPNQSGQQVKPGSRMIVQMHYSTLAEGDLSDQSSVNFMLEREVEREGIYLPWFNIAWYLQPTSMLIPSGQEGVKHSFRGKLGSSAGARYIADHLNLAEGAYLHAIFPHMHTLGRTFNVRHISSEGQVTPLLQIPDYDFNWQREYHLQDPVYIGPDDELELECVWDNTMEKRFQTGMMVDELFDVAWGDGTYDEMCIGMMYLTPSATSP